MEKTPRFPDAAAAAAGVSPCRPDNTTVRASDSEECSQIASMYTTEAAPVQE